MAHPYWPLFDLSIRTSRLELRYPTDEDIVGAASAAAQGVHDPGFMPFFVPWTRETSPVLERNVMQYHWQQRANWSVDSWQLPLVVVVDGQVVGQQGLEARRFPLLREALSGSWLTRHMQGQGLGKEMRAAIVHFGFESLCAQVLNTAYFEGNAASQGVTEALGYEPNGRETIETEGERTTKHHFRLTRERWVQTRPELEVTVEGFDACRPLFGLERQEQPGA